MLFQSLDSIRATGRVSPILSASSPLNTAENIAPAPPLEAAARLPTQLSAFVGAVTETFLASAVVEFVLGTDAEGSGALLPLCRNRGYFARWRIVGTNEVFEPSDVISESPIATRSLADSLARQPRPLCFDRMPSNSLFIPALRRAMRGKGWVSLRPAVSRPVITLDESWIEPAAQFNAGRRSDFRRAMRKAESCGAVTFEVLTPTPSDFHAVFDEAVGVELHSWKQAAGSALALDDIKLKFFKRFFLVSCRKSLCRIAFMRIDGRPVAMQMALQWADRFWLFKIGYDEEFRHCSPGNLLMLHTIAHAAARGLKSYELLGNCERWISDFWTREQLACVRLRTYPANLRGAWALAVDTGSWLMNRVGRKAR